MTYLQPAYRATVFASKTVDPTESTPLTPANALVGGAQVLPTVNWFLQSQALGTNPPWTPTALVASNNAATAPDGTSTATYLVPSVANSLHYVDQSLAITAGENLGWSGFVKSDGTYQGFVIVVADGTVTNGFRVGVDLVGGATCVVTRAIGQGVFQSAFIQPLTNGWFWVSVTGQIGAGVTTAHTFHEVYDTAAHANALTAFAGDASHGVFVWGVQFYRAGVNVVAAPVFNDYVPTTGAAGTAVFKVSTIENVVGFRPYMAMPTGRRGRLDLLSKKTDTGEMGFDLLDPRATPGGSNALRFATSFTGDTTGLPTFARPKLFMEESLDGGVTWAPFFTGRTRLFQLKSGSRTVMSVSARDMSDDLTWTLFPGMPHAAVYQRDVPSSTGTATAATSTTISDTLQAWTTNQFAGLYVRLTAGTGAGQVRLIASNTGTQITVSTAWAVTPDTTTQYAVGGYAQLVSVMPVGFIYPYGIAPVTPPIQGIISSIDASNNWAVVAFNKSQVGLVPNNLFWTKTFQAITGFSPFGAPIQAPPTAPATFTSPPTFTGQAIARMRRLDTNAEGDFLVGYGYVIPPANVAQQLLSQTPTATWALTIRPMSFPLGVATGAPTASGAQAANPTATTSSVTTTGWTISTNGILLQGDIISFASDQQRYQVTANANSDGSGNATLTVSPGLQVALTNGEVITVQRSPARMALPPVNTAIQIHVVADLRLGDGGSKDANGNYIAGNLLMINDAHPAQVLQDVLSGYFGLIYRPRYDSITGQPYVALDTGKNLGDPMWSFPFSQSAFSAIIADQSFPPFRCVIDQSMPMRDFIEKYICLPYGLGYFFDGSGNFVPVDLRERTSVAGLTTLTDADVADQTVPSWQYDASQAVTNAKITVYAEAILQPIAYLLNTGDQFPTITSKMLDVQGGQIIDLSIGNIDLGQQAATLDFKGYRAQPGETGFWFDYSGQFNVGTRWQAIQQWAIRMAHSIVSHPFGNGVVTVTLTCVRNANTASIQAGTWFLYQVSGLPAADTNLRSTTRIAICTERREDGAKVTFTGIDWGVGVVANAPTLGTPAQFAGDTSHSATCAITVNAQNEPAEVWVSVQPNGTGAAPADSDHSWVFVGWSWTSWVATVRGMPSNSVIFWRARTIPKRLTHVFFTNVAVSTLKLPSAWAHAATGVTLASGLTAPGSLATSGTVFSTQFTVTWTNADATKGLEVRLASPAGAAYSFIEPLPPGSTTYTFTGLAPSTQYQVSVRTVDGVGGFAESTLTQTTPAATPCIIPMPPGPAIVKGTRLMY